MSGALSGSRQRRLAALLRKETVQVVRDPSNVLIAFVLPLLLIFLFGYGVSLDTGRTRIAVSNASGGEKAASLLAALGSSRWLDVARAGPLPSLRDDLVAGRVRAIVVVPADFERRLASGGDGAIQIMTDGSQPNTAGFAAAYVDGVFRNWVAAEALETASTPPPRVELGSRFRYNPELASRYFLVPGAIAIIMTLIGTLLTALVIAREWERGTMEALMATPVAVGEIIAGKILPYFILGLGSMALCTVLAVTVFGVPLRGSIPALLLLAAAFLMPALGQGLLISAAVRNQFVASQVALLSAFLPSFLLSGAIFEIASMPWPIRMISHIVPAGYLIPSIQTVFSVGDVWPMFLKSIAALLAFGGLFFALAFQLTSKRLD